MNTGTFLVISIGVILAYNVIMRILDVIDNKISANKYSRAYRNRDIDIDDYFKDIN